jgi:DNA-binding transcriptional MerR regulator
LQVLKKGMVIMKQYSTASVAKIVGIHPNTVRLYEELGLISKPQRQANGYRTFTELHLEQIKLVRLAFQIEVLQNGLRKKIIEVVKTAAVGEFDQAIHLIGEYLQSIQLEQRNAEEAIEIVKQLLSGRQLSGELSMKRKEVSSYLQISMDTLRNWEMNGLVTVKRKENGYRVYSDEDIRRLKIIRSLRCANYSLESILRMLHALSADPQVNIKKVLDTPKVDEDIISVCDKLITSLQAAEYNARIIQTKLYDMKNSFEIIFSR